LKLIRIATLAAAAGILGLSPAGAGNVQEVHGWVFAPIPGRAAGLIVDSCPGVVDAVLRLTTGTSLLARFPVDASTWGQPFTLRSGSPASGIDISFSFGGGHVWFDTFGLGGEQGVVPHGAADATVCLTLGTPTVFTYRGGAGVAFQPASSEQVRGVIVVPALWECTGYTDAVLETAARQSIGYTFPVSAGTRGLPFLLQPDLPTADIDIAFRSYVHGPWTRFSSRQPGESGIVPVDASEARVCLYAGTPTWFTYSAG
jgi:hypothetical protein